MKLSVIILFGLVSLASSRTLESDPGEKCKGIEPEEYCASTTLIEKCEKIDFCQQYLRLHICDKGPAAYCKTSGSALTCGKEAYCLTWPDDSVKAVKIPAPPTLYDRIATAISDTLSRRVEWGGV